MDPNANITKVRGEVAAMQQTSEVCRAIWGGTSHMRKLGKKYLPIWPQEEQKAWEARRDCSVLYPGFKKALETMVGRPFESPIGIGSDVPPRIEQTLEDIDRQGRDLDTFARDILTHALRDGITWILVDYPTMPENATAADEAAMGARPYWVEIPLENMIAYRTEMVAGSPVVTHARWYECTEVQVDPWTTEEVKRIRVWERGHTQVWEKRQAAAEEVWVMVEEAFPTLQEVPIVAIYGGRTGFWCAEPPLEDLAWLNVMHWQSLSDQRHVLHVARVPLLAADADMEQDNAAAVSVGVQGIMTRFTNLRFVEHTGAAIGAGRQDLQDIEAAMRKVAGELLDSQVQKTATQSEAESSEGASWLRRIVANFEDALEACLQLSADWLGLPQGGSLTLTTDWDEERLAADVIVALTTARNTGAMTQKAYSWNMKQGGVLPPDWTVEQEMDALAAEGPVALPRGNQPPPMPPQPGLPQTA